MEEKVKQERLWTPIYIYLLSILVITGISSNLISTAFAQYAVDCGIGLGLAGVLTGLFSLVALVGRPVSGVLSDTMRQKSLMIISVSGIVISALVYPLCRTPFSLFLIRVLHGLFFSLNGTVNMAFAAAFVPRTRMGEGMGYFGLTSILAQAVAPSMGFALARAYGYNALFYTVCILNAAALVMMIFLKDPSDVKVKDKKEKKKISWSSLCLFKLLPYSGFTAAISMVNGICSSFLALLGASRGMDDVGIFFTVTAIVLAVVRPFSGKLNDRKGLDAVVYPGYVCSFIALILIGVMNAPWMLVVAAVFKALGQGMAQPAFQAECIRSVGEDQRGAAVGTYYIGADVGNGFAPVIGGYIAEQFGYEALSFGAAGVMALCFVLFYFYRRGLRRRSAAAV